MKKPFFRSFVANTDPIPNIEIFIREANISHIAYAGGIFIFFDLLNLSNFSRDKDLLSANVRWASVVILVASALFVVLTRVFFRACTHTNRRARLVYMLFWGLMFLGMVPLFILDINCARDLPRVLPLNMTLFATLLLVVPIFSRRELLFVYPAFFAANVLLGALHHAPAPYYAFCVGLSAGCLALAYAIQHQYVRMISQLNVEAQTDPLTGLLNRRGGLLQSAAVWEVCKRHGLPVAAYMVDIDFFKKYNDRFGHQAGDRALAAMADAIHSVFGRASDVLCRYGGEEFFVLASVEDAATAQMLAERLLQTVQHLPPAAGCPSEASLSVSIGYTLYQPGIGQDDFRYESLVEQADQALYHAKKTGRNRICAH